MWKGTLTQLVKSEVSQLRTPGQATEVEFMKFPEEGQRFECFGKSLTDGGDFRWISTSPVVTLVPERPEGTAATFTTKSGSEYRLETFSG